MNQSFNFKTITLVARNSISSATARRSFFLVALALACFALSRAALAVSPAPDGGYARWNTAEGTNALFRLTTGVYNTALGGQALFNNTTGNYNTAVGLNALYYNTTGFYNTATGAQALFFNTTGIDNTANGLDALFSNTTGVENTANGFLALFNNTTGNYNTANGFRALLGNTTGLGNTADGIDALVNNTTGNANIAMGPVAGQNLTTGDNNIDIGNLGVVAEANTIRIGTEVAVIDAFGFTHPAHTAAFIAGIYGETTSDAGTTVPVVIDTNGNLGTTASSERFKTEIKPMDKTSEAILELKPVAFHYKKDSKATPQFGLVAEQVAKVNPDLVVRDAKGEIYTVRYDAVNAMLLNEFLKEHRKVEEQGATIAQMKKQIEALTATVQKVNDRIDLEKSSPPTLASQ